MTTEVASGVALRPYQVEAVAAVHDRLASEDNIRRPAVSLPTGSGKTIVFSKIIADRGYPALILAHRDELIEQAIGKYEQIDPSTMVGIVKAGRNDTSASVIAASVQTLGRQKRLEQMPRDFKTIVVDEAHHVSAGNMYSRVLDYFSDTELIVGVSATLERADRKGSGLWEEIVYAKTMLEMIEAGYLVDIRAISIELKQANFADLKVTRGDFADGELGQMLHDAHAPEVVVRAYQEHAAGRKTLVFTPTIALAHEMADTFVDAGIKAEAAWGDMPGDSRKAVLARLASGETQVVANAALLIEGFDEPSIDCVIVARPTRSKPVLVQMVGRGTRLYPGKSDLLVLDVVGASERLDLMTVPKLFGVKDGEASKVGVAAALRQRQLLFGVEARKRAGLADGAVLDSREVNLFDRKDVNWLRLSNGVWMLSMGDAGNLMLEPSDSASGKWHAVVRRGRSDPPQFLGDSPKDLALAMGIAEEFLRRAPRAAQAIADKSARWRTDPANDKQKNALRNWKIPFDEDAITKGEASDLLSGVIATKGTR